MKVRLSILFIISGFIFAGCGNSPQKQQKKVVVQQINPLEKVFKEIIALDSIYHNDKKRITWEQFNDSLRYFIYADVVKKRILHSTSQRYFDKLSSFITYSINDPVIFFEAKYEDGAYKYLVYNGNMERRTDTPTLELSYKPEDNMFTCSLMENGRVVQSDGEIHYNTEGWKLKYRTDEFDEDITSQPMVYYSLMADYDLIPYAHIWILVGWTGRLLLVTNDFGYDSFDISKILIKDNDSGRIYNIAFNDNYFAKGDGALYNDIGVGMWGENRDNFINIVTELKDYSISFINENGENRVIKNPKNLCNICDAIEKFLMNNEK